MQIISRLRYLLPSQLMLYVAMVPELIGCMAHGDTYAEAMNEIKDAMELHIEMIQELGEELPHPKLLA